MFVFAWKDDKMRGAECRKKGERRQPENIQEQRKTCEFSYDVESGLPFEALHTPGIS